VLETIWGQQMEIKELKQEIDDYCQALDELTDVVGAM
jgi:phage host-nuclease inhibitor protein Gam